MRSCQNSTMFCHRRALILRKNPLLLFFPCQGLRRNVKFRCVLDQIVPKFTVSSSLSSVLTSGNAIAAAAAVSGGSVHGAVTSAITQVAVTAVAIASGACLSTKVDFLWPKVDEQPGSLLLDGVDVTGYPIFNDDKVQKAIAFARKAHNGQLRRTGEPYLTHCIHTGKIVAVLVPSTGKRAIDTVVAGILHDVVDDTGESLDTIEREFDADVANLVAGVSRLSFINQLLRRHRRLNVNQAALSHDETLQKCRRVRVGSSKNSVFLKDPTPANNLRVMLLGMVDDPRVVLIKLADRLHNMRTMYSLRTTRYALPPAKAQAVAQETLVIWCSLASRLGLWALKAELEDLCFAVLQPQIFLRMRADLASMWSHPNRTGNARKIYGKFSSLLHQRMKRVTTEHEEPSETDEENICMKVLLQAVLPFDLLQDRKKRTDFFNQLVANSNLETTPKVVRDAAFALGTLVVCEEALERELFISTSYVPGMEVTLSGRLKSLFSIYSKMKRKEIGINKVYDARALRVIVGDKNGALHSQAVQSCYNLLNIVHRLWSPIDGEFDDYIVNPKPSGYQSLHTAVQGPDNSPLEIQIRTQRMHECAEHGLAAHWLYKETEDKLPLVTSVTGSGTTTPSFFSTDIEDQGSIEDDGSHKYSSLKVGDPVLRVEAGQLLAAVIVRVDKGARELLVAVSFGLAASEAVADRRSSSQTKRWEAFARLYKKVSDEWWCEPGHGDWCTCLEKYTLCQDGMYHKQDQFERLLPTFIQIIELTEEEENVYWAIMSAIFEGKPVASVTSNTSFENKLGYNTSNPTLRDSGINNKVYLLRTMLQWEKQLRSEASQRVVLATKPYEASSGLLGEVVIVCWPHGEIMRLSTGSTAADAARRAGLEGKLVSVNGQLVVPNTKLKDGDVVEIRM